MKLIIAEKPSLGRNIAAAIGNMTKHRGYMENGDYIVTWAFGHLFSLYDIEDYTGTEPGKWDLGILPCYPESFAFKIKPGADKKPDRGIEEQFETVNTLCSRQDVDVIINAGDADREGEIIVRILVSNCAGAKGKAFKRLWLPDQTGETIIAGLSELKDEAEYDSLANEGFARTYIDWLYGVNLTRFATLKTGTLLRVGRVIVPIVKAIYDRDTAIRNFKPDVYYALVSRALTNGEEVELTSKYKFTSEEAEKAQRACSKLNAQRAYVKDKKSKKDTLNPGKLYSLTKLQNYLGRKYKMSMDESLKITQDLYEKGYLTYPRTNSEYLATAEKDKIKKIIGVVAGKGYPVVFKDKKTIFDDSKIESHSALTPTYKFPEKNALSDSERLVYTAVLRRFVSVFCSEECVAQKTEMTIAVGECEDYVLKGTVIIEPGFTRFDDSPRTAKILPKLEKGDEVNIDFKPVQKETSPPKHYTIETLNNYLKNPFREDKQAASDDDTEDYRAIFEGLELGTEATRTGIIENAKKSRYIELKKDTYYILPAGEYLIESIKNMQISMDKYKTSFLGQALKKVYHGEISVDESVELAKKEISEVFSAPVNNSSDPAYSGFFGEEIGVCPLCGGRVIKGRYKFGCEKYKDGCKFGIGNVICGKIISAAQAKQLLTDGKTEKLDGFVSRKTGREFSSALKIENGEVIFDF